MVSPTTFADFLNDLEPWIALARAQRAKETANY